MPPLYLLIKPASGNCNLRCNYCFYSDVTSLRKTSSYGVMSFRTLEKLVKEAFIYAENECTFSFQGGEPTLAGLPFYQELIRLCGIYNKNKLSLHFAMQTNGYRLTEEWAAFFAAHHFLVGISLDGTVHTHNACRRTPEGEGTFSEVMDAVGLLRRYHVDFNILTVVNKKTAANINKIYKFYQKNKFEYLQFIPCLDPFYAVPGSMEYSLTNEAYSDFLCRLFDLWYLDFKAGRGISIRQFDNYLSLLLYGYAESCDMNGVCGIQHVIEADGSVYPCDFFVLDSYCLGNITETDFKTINQRRGEIKFIENSEKKPDSCLLCEYYAICRGGCMRYRVMSAPDWQAFCAPYPYKNYFCFAYYRFFSYALPRLKELAALVYNALIE